MSAAATRGGRHAGALDSRWRRESRRLTRITLLADALREAEPGCAVLGVHHTGKDAARGTRGHSSLPAAVDWSLAVTAQDDGAHLATVDKVRDGVGGDFGFRLRVVELGSEPTATPSRRASSTQSSAPCR